MIRLISWDSYGTLKFDIRGALYIYNVEPARMPKILKIAQKSAGKALALAKKFAGKSYVKEEIKE